jgi:purine-binding chemotaxis protein CheW
MDLLDIRKKAKGLKKAEQAGEPEAAAPAPAPPPREASAPVVTTEERAGAAAEAAGLEGQKGAGLEGQEEPGEPAAGEGAALEYLAFMLAGEEYAVKVDDVLEIIRPQHITSVPRAPGFILGITSLRGVIVPVFDIRIRLGLEAREPSRSTRILVISDGGLPHGIVVDSVTGVVRLGEDDIEPPPSVIGGVDAEYLEGVGRVSGRLLILFNTGRVLSLE